MENKNHFTYENPITEPINDIEVQPLTVVGVDSEGAEITEVCEEKDAQFYSVYVHLVSGGVMCVADRPTKKEAEQYAAFIKSICDYIIR